MSWYACLNAFLSYFFLLFNFTLLSFCTEWSDTFLAVRLVLVVVFHQWKMQLGVQNNAIENTKTKSHSFDMVKRYKGQPSQWLFVFYCVRSKNNVNFGYSFQFFSLLLNLIGRKEYIYFNTTQSEKRKNKMKKKKDYDGNYLNIFMTYFAVGSFK